MKHQLTLCFLILQVMAVAQRREEIFDFSFNPTKSGGYYYVVTEKEDTLWKRQAWYLSQKTMYMEGWHKDENCKIGHGEFKWYHSNGRLRSAGKYLDGYREGTWLWYDEEGRLDDSLNYTAGRKIGIGYKWHDNGYMADSTNFDGKGNGVEVSWHDDGALAAAGYWMQDTLKRGKWQYYHRNGTIKATEQYDASGKLIVCNCFDEKGTAIDTALCREKEASIDARQWKRFLENNLTSFIEQKAKEGIRGEFTVMVRFIVDKDGSITDLKPLTNYGYGIEEGVLKIMKRLPKWTPGRVHGETVRSYHTQPITFVIDAG